MCLFTPQIVCLFREDILRIRFFAKDEHNKLVEFSADHDEGTLVEKEDYPFTLSYRGPR